MTTPSHDRRRLLQGGLASAATMLLGAPLAADARPARAADFAAAAAGNPMLLPLAGVDEHSGQRDAVATLIGRWPAELQGRFHRNGPALFERAGERYHHWFDGDGMVQQYRIDGGRVVHRGRLVKTAKLQREQAAGRFVVSALGTAIPGQQPTGGPDSFNTANTSVLEHGGRLMALWEGGSAHELDLDTLETRGPVTWRGDLAQVPFSAHPKVDPQGHLWNIGSAGRQLVVWHVDPAGRLVKIQALASPFPGGMVHDMAVTKRWLVVPLPPLKLDFTAPADDGPRRFAMSRGEPLRVLLLDKHDVRKRHLFELPPQMLFHVGNAHEEADGTVVLSYVGAADAWFMDRGAVAMMAGRPEDGGHSETCLMRLDPATGRARVQRPGDAGAGVEFPRVHPARVGQSARWLALGAAWGDASRGHGFLHGVQLLDVHTGRTRRFDYGTQAIAEEHVWVPKPGRSGELDAWLLGTVYDARRRATVLNLLDAAHVEDGPVAQAVLPYALPLGFHGNFATG